MQVASAPMSQSVSSASINGQVTKRVSLMIPVVGARGGTAYARVESSHGPKGVGGMKISVRHSGIRNMAGRMGSHGTGGLCRLWQGGVVARP